MNAASEDSLN